MRQGTGQFGWPSEVKIVNTLVNHKTIVPTDVICRISSRGCLIPNTTRVVGTPVLDPMLNSQSVWNETQKKQIVHALKRVDAI